jgi:hypothetical protein
MALRSRTQVEQVSRQLSELREGMAQTGAARNLFARPWRRRHQHHDESRAIDSADSPLAMVLPKEAECTWAPRAARAIGFIKPVGSRPAL